MSYRRGLAVLLAGLGICAPALLTGCDPDYDLASTDPVAHQEPLDPPPSSKGPRWEKLEPKIAREARDDAERMLGVPAPNMTVTCTDPSGEIRYCTARQAGQQAVMKVRIYDYRIVSAGPPFATYSYHKDTTYQSRFLTRDLVHREFYESLKAFDNVDADTELRCDKMPALLTVPLRDKKYTDTGYRCYRYSGFMTSEYRLLVGEKDVALRHGPAESWEKEHDSGLPPIYTPKPR